MALFEELKKIGFTRSEISAYLYLLEHGISTPPEIAKGTGIARTNCYQVLSQLQRDGLLEVQKKGNRKAYLGRDPEALFRSLEEKRSLVERVLPDLRALHTAQKNKPSIQFYEGFDQVKQVYWQTLSAQKIYAFGSTKQLSETDSIFFGRYMRELKKRNIIMYDILTNASQDIVRTTKSMMRGFYDPRLLPARCSDVPTDMLLWDDHIALITLTEPIFGTVLSNGVMAQTFRTMYEIMWEALGKRTDIRQ